MKLKKFKAIIIGENQFGKPFKRTLIVSGTTARKTYTKLKNSNDVIEILSFKEQQ